MGLKYKAILGVRISLNKEDEVLEEIKKYLKSGVRKQVSGFQKNKKPLIIFTPNPEIITYAQKDEVYKRIVNSAQINIPDGSGIVWALKRKYGIKIDQLRGIEMMENICAEASDYGFRIGLIGGKNGLAIDVKDCLLKTYKNLKIETLPSPTVQIKNNKIGVFTSESYHSENYFEKLAKEIAERRIDILFVALGFPKQEYFIDGIENKRPLVMMGVGGSFEYIAGKVNRAPVWMRERGLEWFYRLINEPWRIKRQISGSEFFIRVLVSP